MQLKPINRHRSALLALILLMGMSIGLVLDAQGVQAQGGDPTGAAYRGKRIFLEHCTQCHGTSGKGNGPMADQAPVKIADFTDPAFVESRSPLQLFEIISEGRTENLMPPWHGSLSDDEIWDAVAYIWSLHLTPEEIATSLQTYNQSCVQCHGQDGAGANADTPSLTNKALLGLTESELRQAITQDSHPPMSELADADLRLATTAARSMGLGFAIAAPKIEGDGAIVVKAQNGTTGEALANYPVRLYIVEGDSLVTDQTLETDETGQARFENLPTGSTWLYLAEIIYEDLPYDSGTQQFDPDSTELVVPVNVYDAGGNVEDISISRAHWVISLTNANSLDVGELYAINNTGDRVYMGEPGPDGTNYVLRFDLPPNATNVDINGAQLGGRFLYQDNAIIDTMPMTPGQRQILFRYNLPVEDGQVSISHPIAYPVANLNLLAPDIGMKIEAPGWVEGERVQAQGDTPYLNYNISNLPPNSNPVATFSGIHPGILPAQVTNTGRGQQIIDANATPGVTGQPYLPYLVSLLALLILGAGGYYIGRRQQAMAALEPLLHEQEKQALIAEIAALDDAYEAGELSKAEYEKDRRLLKAQLMALMREEAD